MRSDWPGDRLERRIRGDSTGEVVMQDDGTTDHHEVHAGGKHTGRLGAAHDLAGRAESYRAAVEVGEVGH
jgi:hypothetical protein